MVFDLKNATVHRAILLNKVLPVNAVHKISWLSFALIVIAAALWFFEPRFLGAERTLGLLMVAASTTFVFWVYTLFFETYLESIHSFEGNSQNIAEYLDYSALNAVEEFLAGPHTDLSGLLLPILELPGSSFILFRLGVSPKVFKEGLISYLHSVSQGRVERELGLFLEDTLADKQATGRAPLINWRDLLVMLASHSDFLRKFIFELKLEKKDLRVLADWQQEAEGQQQLRRRFWDKANLMRTRGIGKDWAAGFTINLEKYASDLTGALGKISGVHLFGRQEETEAIERVLARAGENNAVLVGEEGVGKRTVAYALARRIALGETLSSLAHKRVLELDLGAVLAGAQSGHEVEARLKMLLNDAVRAGNVILLVTDVHALFDSSGAAGTINASEMFLPYLSSSAFQLIGTTSHRGYHETIEKNPSLLRVFEKVEVHEPNKEGVFAIMHDVVPQIERHNQVLISYQAISAAIELTDRYIKNVPFPEKTIDVLQEAAVYAKTKGRSSIVTAEHVEEVVHRKTSVPVGKIALAESEVLLDLEKILHRRIIGQEEAISAIADAMRRARSGIASEKKPIGAFLFLGPTGVGKTETAKALAAVYFGSEARMLRFDMSEYQQPDSVNRLIGTGEQSGLLTTAVLEAPFSLLLFDEVEKAHPNILNLFLQVFDDGRLTDALGRTVDFTNTIIIATSNAGAEMIRESIKAFREANLKERLLDFLQKQGIFRPEFLNRFDATIIYRPLSEEQTEQVVELLLADLNRRLHPKDVTLRVTPELVKKIAQIGFDPQFGARPLRRVIQDRIETLIAKKLLSGEIQRGQTVELRAEEI
ncbi:MAG: ATP-dependent Clp protease ATP-binding subunit [Candidatus Doudnabacteria bacterium]|nr:ATP-dependent Clp protease ATP-binding subunit [Candidatus Doudnabacteria bacterium]